MLLALRMIWHKPHGQLQTASSSLTKLKSHPGKPLITFCRFWTTLAWPQPITQTVLFPLLGTLSSLPPTWVQKSMSTRNALTVRMTVLTLKLSIRHLPTMTALKRPFLVVSMTSYPSLVCQKKLWWKSLSVISTPTYPLSKQINVGFWYLQISFHTSLRTEQVKTMNAGERVTLNGMWSQLSCKLWLITWPTHKMKSQSSFTWPEKLGSRTRKFWIPFLLK